MDVMMMAAMWEEALAPEENIKVQPDLRFLCFSQSSQCVLLLCFSNDGTEFGGSIYQKVNSHMETAVHLAWTAGSNNTRFGIGAKYQLDKDASLSVRAVFK